MNEALYFQKVRDDIDKGAGTYTKVESFAEVALELGYNYPFVQSEVTLDSISADNDKAIWKKLNKYGKVLSKKIPDTIEAETPTFAKHHGFKVNGVAGKEKVRYMPFTLTLGDGQVLTALVRNSEDFAKYTPKDDLLVTKWALNAQDITKEVYKGGNDNIDMATTIARLAKIITFAHTKFVLKNPIENTGTLAKEIDGMVLDLGNVVFETDKTYTEKIKDMEERKNPTKPNTSIDDATAKAVELAQAEVGSGEFRAFALNSEAMKLIEGMKIGDDSLKISKAYADTLDKGRAKLAGEAPKITAENIAEFYPTMSDEELEEYRAILGNIFKDRSIEVKNSLGLKIKEYEKYHKSDTMSERTGVLKESFFGIEDNLEPVDEYIAKIKDSEAYRDYVYSKGEVKPTGKTPIEDTKTGIADIPSILQEQIQKRGEPLKVGEIVGYADQSNNTSDDPRKVTKVSDDGFITVNQDGGDEEFKFSELQRGWQLAPRDTFADKALKEEPKPSSEDIKTTEELNTKYELEKHDFEVEATVKNGYFELVDIGDKPKLVVGGTKEEIEEYILSHKKAVEEANKPTEEQKLTDTELVAKITEDEVYKKIMKDSHGGVMYNVANKYDATHLLELWEQVEHKKSQNGIIKGAMNFLRDDGNISKEEKSYEVSLLKELTKEFLTLTIDDLERATEIMTTVSEAIEKDEEDTEAKEAYEKMNKHLDGMVG